MNMDLPNLKAAAYDKINQIQRLQQELQQLNQIIYQLENPQSANPAGVAGQSGANDDTAKDEQGAETQADAPDESDEKAAGEKDAD